MIKLFGRSLIDKASDKSLLGSGLSSSWQCVVVLVGKTLNAYLPLGHKQLW